MKIEPGPMTAGQIIYVRKAIMLENDVFMISKKTKDERLIILSDDAKIRQTGRFWRNDSIYSFNNDILQRDEQGSIIGDEYRLV